MTHDEGVENISRLPRILDEDMIFRLCLANMIWGVTYKMGGHRNLYIVLQFEYFNKVNKQKILIMFNSSFQYSSHLDKSSLLIIARGRKNQE